MSSRPTVKIQYKLDRVLFQCEKLFFHVSSSSFPKPVRLRYILWTPIPVHADQHRHTSEYSLKFPKLTPAFLPKLKNILN